MAPRRELNGTAFGAASDVTHTPPRPFASIKLLGGQTLDADENLEPMSEFPNQASFAPLATEKLACDRKLFFIDLKENNRGRFLKITEDVAGRRDTIMVPVQVLQEFLEALSRIRDFEAELPK